MHARYKIGFIDEDPIQVKKYKRELRDEFDIIGYKITKGLPLKDLLDQIYDSDVDLLMVDFLMANRGVVNYNGDKVIREFEEIKPRFPMIIFTNEEKQARPKVDNPNIIYDKAKALNEPALFHEILRKNIELYVDYKDKRKSIIERLTKKATKKALSAKEKHQFRQAEFELKNLDKRAVEVPIHLLDLEKIDDLDKTVKEAEDFLASLTKEIKHAHPRPKR